MSKEMCMMWIMRFMHTLHPICVRGYAVFTYIMRKGLWIMRSMHTLLSRCVMKTTDTVKGIIIITIPSI